MSSRLCQCGKHFLLDLLTADFLFPVYCEVKYNTYQATCYWEFISQICQHTRYFLNSSYWLSLYFPWSWCYSWENGVALLDMGTFKVEQAAYSDSHRYCGRGWMWVSLSVWTSRLNLGCVGDTGYWRAGRGVSPYTCPSGEGRRPEVY